MAALPGRTPHPASAVLSRRSERRGRPSAQYDGWAYHTVSGTTPARISPLSALSSEYWSKSGLTFRGFSSSGKNDKSGGAQ